MRAGISILILIAVSTSAFADDQTNVYDFDRQIQKSTDSAIVDEQTTADIKRHMANLLYPVDMTSFARPEKTRNFASKSSHCKSKWGYQRPEL